MVWGRICANSNSSKLFCMSLLPASMKRIRSKTAAKKWQHRFSHYRSINGIFFRRSRAANSAVRGLIWPFFKPLRALMHVIIACRYEKDLIKNKNSAKVDIAPAFGEITTACNVGQAKRVMVACKVSSSWLTLLQRNKLYFLTRRKFSRLDAKF